MGPGRIGNTVRATHIARQIRVCGKETKQRSRDVLRGNKYNLWSKKKRLCLIS